MSVCVVGRREGEGYGGGHDVSFLSRARLRREGSTERGARVGMIVAHGVEQVHETKRRGETSQSLMILSCT